MDKLYTMKFGEGDDAEHVHIEHPTIEQFRIAVLEEDTIGYLKSVIPEHIFAVLSQENVDKIADAIAEHADDIFQVPSKVDTRVVKGYAFPEDVTHTTAQQEDDMKALIEAKRQEKEAEGGELLEVDCYPICAAIYAMDAKERQKYTRALNRLKEGKCTEREFKRKVARIYDTDRRVARVGEMEQMPLYWLAHWALFFSTGSERWRRRVLQLFPKRENPEQQLTKREPTASTSTEQ